MNQDKLTQQIGYDELSHSGIFLFYQVPRLDWGSGYRPLFTK
jgi:hypothetical protein